MFFADTKVVYFCVNEEREIGEYGGMRKAGAKR